MSQQVVIGGDRVGSGKKMRTSIHGWERSTHNLSDVWRSTMGAGILYPCYKKLCTKADVFDIDIEADCRTIPTEGPLFGTYKMQIDFYEVPLRLYIALLHNNARKLGLNMSQVKVPKLVLDTTTDGWNSDTNGKMNKSCLLKYLGFSGMGTANLATGYNATITRKINAIPALAYYDIFKNYYANHQEDKAYVVTGDIGSDTIYMVDFDQITTEEASYFINSDGEKSIGGNSICTLDQPTGEDGMQYQVAVLKKVYLNGDTPETAKVMAATEAEIKQCKLKLWNNTGNHIIITCEEFLANASGLAGGAVINNLFTWSSAEGQTVKYGAYPIAQMQFLGNDVQTEDSLKLHQFDLENIDTMRYNLLSFHTLGASYEIKAYPSFAPYQYLVDKAGDGVTRNCLPLNGLVVKTYQNDIFNNWLNSEWIEGANGINELSKVAVVNNAISMDAINLAEKIYNMMNRVAITKGTYQDWENVQYEKTNFLVPEWPVFIGGMSQEVAFDEVIQTAPYEGSKLGTMGGRGRVIQGTRKGGHIHVKCNEACYIIGICSLTPRINYTQGNDFDLTEIDSIDDLHKPALDGIGYQDLIGERMAWWDTKIDDTTIEHRSKIGKLPAWIEYMTSVDKAYGDFAESVIDNEKSVSYMTLNRNYEMNPLNGLIKDATTYIDPSKWNYPFAYTRLDAQNFWVEIAFKTIARRKMSARLIPNV